MRPTTAPAKYGADHNIFDFNCAQSTQTRFSATRATS